MSVLMPLKKYLDISKEIEAHESKMDDGNSIQFNVSNYESIIADIQGVVVSIHEPVTVDTITL